MRRLFSVNNPASAIDLSLLIARIGISAMMLTHALPKLAKLFGDSPVQFPEVMGMSATLSISLAIFSELICSILILIGFGTRIAVIPLIITMLVAVFSIHATDPFSIKESASLYLLGYVVLLLAGSGRYSVDGFLYGQTRNLNRARINKPQPQLSAS